jgi:tetratricopeptide (TPR) repeat protein
MIFKVKKLTLVLGSALVLSGCASYNKRDLLADMKIKPVMQVQHSSSTPKIMYLLGRYHQGKINYKKAIVAYKKALAADSDYVEVHNGLGVIYSVQGKHELAVQHFQKAINLAPEATYLHNNLGYAYLIQGRETEAAKSLQLALKLDPGNKQARSNLATTFERVDLYDNAAILRLAAPGTTKPSVNPATSLHSTTTINVPDITIEGSLAQVETKTKLIQVTPNVYKYESNKKHDLILALISSDQTSVLNNDVRIEVSNGNGVTGMAKKVSGFFQKNGFAKARLTNHQTFTQLHTTIYYQSGNHEQANQINQMLPKRATLLENNELQRNIQVKILLGQDISHHIAHFNKKDNMKVIAKNNAMDLSN